MSDKKRRRNITSEKSDCKKEWLSAMILHKTYETCGITYKKFNFIERYGQGHFEYYIFDGLYLGITDVKLTTDFKISTKDLSDTLELSFLIEGEQVIRFFGITNEIIYESQEGYFLNLSTLKTNITYHKKKRLKEVKIRISPSFIKRHSIDKAYNLLENYTLQKLKDNFLNPLCVKTQSIICEIISDSRTGLLKRLFLESKTLELIALQLEATEQNKQAKLHQTDNLLKKMYQIQHLITTNLNTQYSIQELARQIGVNDFLLKKEFKRVFKQTIFEYSSEARMEKAKQLLEYTTKPIYEISELVGYKNATHFTAAFKKQEKITPKNYRVKIKKEVK